MLPVLTSAEMRDADRRTIEEVGLPGAVLMENAGAAVVRVLRERYPRARKPLVLCGRGNNGGDGFVVARRLLELSPAVILLAGRADVTGDARVHMGAFERSGGVLQEAPDAAAWERICERAQGDIVVDALLGTGLHQEPTGLAAAAIAQIRAWRERGLPVVAVDLPSGLPSDTGEVTWPTVRADVTVTIAAAKYGHVLPPACDAAGDVVVADIGIPPALLSSVAGLWLLEASDARRPFGARPPGSHKGTFGHVLVIGGSRGKTGAAVLAATAALRVGAGLVTVAVPETVLASVASARPEVMTEPLPSTSAGGLDRKALDRLIELARDRDAVVLGPGLGQDPATRDLVRDFVRRCPAPLVVDADGLNALAEPASGSGERGPLGGGRPVLLTPHPGEMARLAGVSTAEVQRRRLETARAQSVATGAVVVLKGQRTLIARPDGRAAVNPTGNPGLATAGTGDVLSGVAGALLARGADAWTAATAAVYVHGAAGDEAARRQGQESMVAGDVIESLPAVLQALLAEDGHS